MKDHRLIGSQVPTYQRLKHHAVRSDQSFDNVAENVSVDCGWGRIHMGHTFRDSQYLAEVLCQEIPGKRDIALYVSDPHVVLSYAPQQLFLDPSDTLRLNLSTYRSAPEQQHGVMVRRIQTLSDAESVNRIYQTRGMVTADADFIWEQRCSKTLIYLVAEDA